MDGINPYIKRSQYWT